MAATVEIKESNLTSGNVSTVSTLSFCTADTSTPGTDYPLIIPPAGTYRSYSKVLSLYATTAPVGTINNLQWYTDGDNSLGTGVSLYAGTSGTFIVPAGTVGTNGTDSIAATTDAFSYTSGSPLAVSGAVTATSGRITTEFVYLQIDVASTASAGAVGSETFYFQYDET